MASLGTSSYIFLRGFQMYERYEQDGFWSYTLHSANGRSKVYEKKHNGKKWVYSTSSKKFKGCNGEKNGVCLKSLTCVQSKVARHQNFFGYTGILAVTKEGEVLQREPTKTGKLRWIYISPTGMKVNMAGATGPAGQTFMIDSKGYLLERNFYQNAWVKFPKMTSLGEDDIYVVADALNLRPDTVFCITKKERKLVAYRQMSWIDFQLPREGAALYPAVGVYYFPMEKSHLRIPSLFFLSTIGIVRFQFTPEDETLGRWFIYGHFNDNVDIVTPPALAVNHNMMFCITSTLDVVSLNFATALEFRWIVHGKPGATEAQLAKVQPVYLQGSHRGLTDIVLFMLDDGNQASLEYSKKDDTWRWFIHYMNEEHVQRKANMS